MSDNPSGVEPNEPDASDEIVDDEIEEPIEEEVSPDAGDDPGEDEPPLSPAPAQPARRTPRGQPTGQLIRDLNAKNAALERRLDEMLARQNAPRQPTPAEIAEQQRIEQERYEAMTPYQQLLYQREQFGNFVQQAVRGAVQPLQDNADLAEYERALSNNPKYRQFDADVDAVRRRAPGLSRIDALKYAMGDSAYRNGGAAVTRQRNAAATNAARHAAQPSNSRGDVAPDTGRRNSVAERLRGQLI